jgi:acetolactate synthase-1/2/3 large subunit
MQYIPTVSELIADVVAAHTDTVFSLMGNGNAHFVSSLTKRGHRVVNVRHETATVIAGQTYFLSTGKIAAASVTFAAGFINVLTSLTEARLARIPIVVVTGGHPTSGLRAQDIDQTGAANSVYVRTLRVDKDNAAAITEAAFEIAKRDRVPVIVEIPYDLVDRQASESGQVEVMAQSEVLRTAELAETPRVDLSVVKAVAQELARAKRPLILAGRGAVIADAGAELRVVGDRVGALFATSILANQIFGSEWDIGLAGGFSSQRAADLIGEADVVLVMGASLNLYQMRYNKLLANAQSITQVDTLAAATHAQVTRFVRSDAKAFASALANELKDVQRDGWRVSAKRPFTGDTLGWTEFGPDNRLDPRAVMDAFERILPRERTITQDTGHFMGWAARHLSAPDPKGMMLPGLALQSIGLGAGSALGVAVGRPDRLPVLVTGDGGLAMELNEIDTLVREAESALVIVLNDAAYGMEVHQYVPRGLDPTAMVFAEMDFAKIGQALGAQGAKVRTLADLDHVSRWLEQGAKGVFIADVAISAEIAADWLGLSNAYYASLNS